MKKSKIYTRGGDEGFTSLIGGSRVKKCHLRLNAYGTIDELNANLGLLSSMIDNDKILGEKWLSWIQSRLFDAGAHLAQPNTNNQEPTCLVMQQHVAQLETLIDSIDAQLEPLHSFILPGGCSSAAQCHVCRTICRRAERLIIHLSEEVTINVELLSFINRLSDFLFVYARYLNKINGHKEISWEKDGI